MSLRASALMLLALVAFAANSILTRAALDGTAIDPVAFTLIRIASGAMILIALVRLRAGNRIGRGSWASAFALFGYAILFSLAYASLSAATGALLLFGAVQITMVAWARYRGQRLRMLQLVGLGLAIAGLVWLLAPGLAAPPALAAAMMLSAGVCWGVYTLRGKGSGDPLRATAANFLRALLPAAILALVVASRLSLDREGVLLALASGALASGLGYAIWYAALRHIDTHTAAVSQLSVPVITAVAGLALLAEPVTPRLTVAGIAILAGIALVVWKPAR